MTIGPARRLVGILAALALLVLLRPALADEKLPREVWLGMYLNGKKIGYTDLRVEESTYSGRPAIKASSISKTQIALFGATVSQDVRTVTFADSSYTPLHQEYHMSSNGSSVHLVAEFQGSRVTCDVDAGGGKTTKAFTVPKGAKLIGDATTANQGKPMTVGQKETYYFLNPMTVALEPITVEVQAQEPVTLDGKAYTAQRVATTMSLGLSTSWESLDGDLLKQEMAFAGQSITMYQQSKEAAQDFQSKAPVFTASSISASSPTAYKPPADFALATAIKVDRPIEKPRDLHALTATLRGITDPSRILSDGRQQLSPESGMPGAFRLSVVARRFDAAESVALPITATAVKPYMERAAYLETDDPQIRATAEKLRGQETNAYKVALAIRKWVHATMKPDYGIGVPQSCVTLYKSPRGVCRDYATLFAGVARAAGIPTRVVGGIVYAEGKFFYHAWDECWVGRWVPMDSTLPGDFVDATHVKFAQGDVTEMYNVANVVGRIKLHVLKAE